MLTPINNRIKGEYYGNTRLTPPVDISLDELTERTIKTGIDMLVANGAVFDGKVISIPVQKDIVQQEREYFHPNQFTQWWNREWTISRAGFGAPGGGVRGIRGGTFLDGEILSTYPRDEVRGVRFSCTRKIMPGDSLRMEIAADPGRVWKLSVYAGNTRLTSRLIDGGKPLDWPEITADAYPQPLEEYERSASMRKWINVDLDLSRFAGSTVEIRLYQDVLVRNGFPGNAYWRNLRFE